MSKSENKKKCQKITSVGMITRINQAVTALLNGILLVENYSLYEYILIRTACIPSLWYLFPWNVITSVFMHECVFHLLGNMTALAMVGYDVEEKYGGKNFMIMYLLCGVVSAFFSPYMIVLGASGAIAGIVAIKLAMIADKEDFTNKFGFVAINALLYDVLLEIFNLSGNAGCTVHVYGSLIGIFIYYEQKNGHLDWLLDKSTINNAAVTDNVKADEITSGNGNHVEPVIAYPVRNKVEKSGSCRFEETGFDKSRKFTDFAATAA